MRDAVPLGKSKPRYDGEKSLTPRQYQVEFSAQPYDTYYIHTDEYTLLDTGAVLVYASPYA